MLQASSFHAGVEQDWQTIDRALRTIARRRAALDAEEARWLRESERCQIWRELGMVSALDYLERVLGYSPRAGQDRLRVARTLEALPVLTEALAHGQLSYSAVRELTRFATPGTERAWCDAAIGKNLRQIEELVSGRHLGHHPDDPRDRRRARGRADRTGEVSIALTVCERCQQGWQEGAGAKVAVDESTIERARCDAQEIGSIDSAEPARAHQDVAPSVMRLVWRRDGGRCRVPGCRSSRGIEAHHLVHRAHGGSHEASNLILLCSACHAAHHRGKLKIRGTASQLEVERCAELRAHVGAHGGALAASVTCTQAKEALIGLGWRTKIAAAAVQEAARALGDGAALEPLIVEALRRCPHGAS